MISESSRDELASSMDHAVSLGISTIQLWPRYELSEPEWLDLAEMVQTRNLNVVALGGYINPLLPNGGPENNSKLQSALEHALALDCEIVVTWSGTKAKTLFDDHPLNETEEALAETADRFGLYAAWAEAASTSIAIEPFHNHVARTPARLRELVEAIGSPRIGTIMDPPNFIKSDSVEQVNARLEEMFDTLGNRIILAHAKDIRRPFQNEVRGIIDNVALPHPGNGILDYQRYGQLLRQYYDGPLVIEHVSRDTLEPALAYVLEQIGA
jgi:sugar phosphate isomerase/epimerase